MRARRLGPHLRAVLARKWAERPNRVEGPFVLAGVLAVNTRSLRATRPLICPFTPKAGANGDPKTRDSLTPFEMTLCKWFEYTEKFKLYHYRTVGRGGCRRSRFVACSTSVGFGLLRVFVRRKRTAAQRHHLLHDLFRNASVHRAPEGIHLAGHYDCVSLAVGDGIAEMVGKRDPLYPHHHVRQFLLAGDLKVPGFELRLAEQGTLQRFAFHVKGVGFNVIAAGPRDQLSVVR